jgi:hypothetical protein
MTRKHAAVLDIHVPDPEYRRTGEAAEFLRVSPRTMEKWRSCGIGPVYSRSSTGGILYKLRDLIAFADAERVSTLDQAA